MHTLLGIGVFIRKAGVRSPLALLRTCRNKELGDFVQMKEKAAKMFPTR